MNVSRLIAFVLASVVVPSLAATITDASQLAEAYDYVIVGGGTAGLALASRLSENANVSVLVLEAGGSDEGIMPMQAPFLGPTLTPHAWRNHFILTVLLANTTQGTNFDWNYTAAPQAGLNGRTFPYPRGRVLGGSSSVNYLFHQLGTKEDWDRYAAVSGDEGWAWKNMRNYVQKHERLVPPIDGHDTTGKYLPSIHGYDGEVEISLNGFNSTIDSRIIGVTKDLPHEFPYNIDLSGGDHPMLGLGNVKISAGGGVRSSSSSSYLARANSRPNLTVLINATVMKLLPTTAQNKRLKAFRRVQFANAGSQTRTVDARKEVILSAGAIGSPQILMLSGIGDPEHLKTLNITVAVNRPDVGANLSDHTFLSNIFEVNPSPSQVSRDEILQDNAAVQKLITEYVTAHSGMFANNLANHWAFLRLPNHTPIFHTNPDPAPGPLSPHWELINSDFYIHPTAVRPSTGTFLTVVCIFLTPTSRGSVTLQSNNIFDKPIIDPKFLTTNFDVVAMREMVRGVLRYAAAPSFSGHIIGRSGEAFSRAKTDAEIDDYVRSNSATSHHPAGTASMSAFGTEHGVVNPDLSVKGTEGLRVVDASVFPFVPSCHTQGPVYLLAERAADIIKSHVDEFQPWDYSKQSIFQYINDFVSF